MNKKILIGVIAIILITAIIIIIQISKPKHEIAGNIRIGYLPIAAELPLFVAIEQGYFKDMGIEVQLERFASSNELGNAATADRVDILAGAASNVIFDIGHVSGKKHLAFCINPYSNTSGHVTDHLLVKKGSGITRLNELRGKKIASFPGSVNRIFCYLILEKYGVPRNSYEYIELLPKDWQPALQTGQVDAVSALEPTATQIMHDSVGVSIFPGFYADLMPDVPLSGHWIAADFYTRVDKRQIVVFLDAYEKAIDFCRRDISAAKKYLVKYANVREDILNEVNLNPWKKLSEIDLEQFQRYIDLLANNQALQSRVSVQDYVLHDPRK